MCVSDLEWHEPHHDTGDQVMRPLICPAGKSAEVPDLCQPSWAQWIPMDPNGSMDTENLTRNMMICLSVFNYDAVSPPQVWMFQDQNVVPRPERVAFGLPMAPVVGLIGDGR